MIAIYWTSRVFGIFIKEECGEVNLILFGTANPVGIYLLKINNSNTRTRREICSKLTIKTSKRRQRQWRRSGVFIVNFELISHLVLVFLLLTLNNAIVIKTKETFLFLLLINCSVNIDSSFSLLSISAIISSKTIWVLNKSFC